jgi:hypothetical protein
LDDGDDDDDDGKVEEEEDVDDDGSDDEDDVERRRNTPDTCEPPSRWRYCPLFDERSISVHLLTSSSVSRRKTAKVSRRPGRRDPYSPRITDHSGHAYDCAKAGSEVGGGVVVCCLLLVLMFLLILWVMVVVVVVVSFVVCLLSLFP